MKSKGDWTQKKKRDRPQPAAYGQRHMAFVPRTMGPMAVTERKYFDTYISAVAMVASVDWTGTELDPTAGAVNCLFYPTEGAALNQRVGRKVSVVKLQMRGMINVTNQTNQTASDAAASVRLVLYIDQQTNGTMAQGEDIMNASAAANALNTVCSMQATKNFGRFRVLTDKTLVIQNPNMVWDGTNVEQGGLIKPFKITIKFKKPVVVRYNGTNGGTIADVIDNSFHFLGTCSAISLAPTMTYECRVVYKDA